MREEDFLGAIRATPGDTALRLAYADWLEERGDPRHELVRVCEAMRAVPVSSDRYWGLKARRNELWARCPVGWLEATGYDGSYYDPVFRDGVPGGWRERWRLVREFTERWHGVAVPDVGGWRPEVRQTEERLGLALPPSAREYVAYAHDLGSTGRRGTTPLRPPRCCSTALYQMDRLASRDAVGLIYYTLDDTALGVALEDLGADDPPHTISAGTERRRGRRRRRARRGDRPRRPPFFGPSLTQSVFRHLFIELPTAGPWRSAWTPRTGSSRASAGAFPVHARFDDADVYEGDEMLALVGRARDGEGLMADVVIRAAGPGRVRPWLPLRDGPEAGDGVGHARPGGVVAAAAGRTPAPRGAQPPRWVSVLRRGA